MVVHRLIVRVLLLQLRHLFLILFHLDVLLSHRDTLINIERQYHQFENKRKQNDTHTHDGHAGDEESNQIAYPVERDIERRFIQFDSRCQYVYKCHLIYRFFFIPNARVLQAFRIFKITRANAS